MGDGTKKKIDLSAKPVPWGGYDWDKPSKVVVALAGDTGVVLWTVGAHVRHEIQEFALGFDDLAFEPRPPDKPGIWVFDEVRIRVTGGWNHLGEDDTEAVLAGTWRRPTSPEWVAIMQERCPWDDREWFVEHVRVGVDLGSSELYPVAVKESGDGLVAVTPDLHAKELVAFDDEEVRGVIEVLSLAGVRAAAEVVAAWTAGERSTAVRWAASSYFSEDPASAGAPPPHVAVLRGGA